MFSLGREIINLKKILRNREIKKFLINIYDKSIQAKADGMHKEWAKSNITKGFNDSSRHVAINVIEMVYDEIFTDNRKEFINAVDAMIKGRIIKAINAMVKGKTDVESRNIN